jgi:hypothetical protein
MRRFTSGDRIALLSAAFVTSTLLAAPATPARAAVVLTYGTAQPAVNGADQASFGDDAPIPSPAYNQTAFSDNAGPPGQIFTTPASPVGLMLNAISLKGANLGSGNSGGGVFTAGTTWGLRVSSVNGTTLTPIETITGIPTVTGAGGEEWFTFTLSGADVPTLAGNTQYAFEVFSSAGYLGFDAGMNPANYPAGTAFNSTGSARAFNSTTVQVIGYDRTFHVDLAAVPEPASASLLGLAAIATLVRRRRP